MIERDIQLKNRLGLHARAAAKMVQVANRFKSSVHLRRDHQEVNAKSILGILLLAAGPGTTLTLIVNGSDENAATEALVQLVEDRFDEEPASGTAGEGGTAGP